MIKRLVLFVLLALMVLPQAVMAQDSKTMTITVEEYKALLKRIEALEAQRGVAPPQGQASSNPANLPMSALIPKNDSLGQSSDPSFWSRRGVSMQDRINLGAELRTRVDNFYLDDHVSYVYNSQGYIKTDAFGFPQTRKGSVSNDNHWTNRFRINMDAAITEDILFHARLAVYKNWGDSDPLGIIGDSNLAHAPDDSQLKLDRFYVDWKLPIAVPVALTVGRLPSTEGLPLGLREDRARQAVFPALMLDAEQSGVVLTLGLEDYTGLSGAGIRFLYAKSYEGNDDLVPYMDNRIGLDDTNMFGLQLESAIPFVDNSCIAFSALWGRDLKYDSITAGDMDLYGIHAQARDLFDAGLDVFVSWAWNESDASGDISTMDLPLVLPDNSTFSFSIPMGMLSSDGKDDHNGWAVYAGLRYTIPVDALKNPKIGFEYNHGSKYWYSFTPASVDLVNRLATRGDVYDVYYIQPLNQYILMRVGYTYFDYDYDKSGSFMGQPEKIDDSLRNFYVMFDARF